MTTDVELTTSGSKKAPQLSECPTLFDDELVTIKEILALLKIGPTKWWEGVKSGIYPKPVKLGSRCTRWSRNSIQQLMEHGVKQ